MGKHVKLKEKQKWSNEKLHLENARKLRGIYLIHTEDKEFKKDHQECLSEVGNISCSCDVLQNYEEELCEWSIQQNQTRLARVLEADEFARLRMGDNYHIIMKTILQENEKNHYSNTILFANLFLCLKL